VINFKDGGLALREEEFREPGVAVLLALERRVDDREVNAISLRCDDVGILYFLGVHVEVVSAESHFRGHICAVFVPEEAEVLEVEGVSGVDIGGLVSGVDVVSHVVVARVHHESVVASVEFSVGTICDLHNIEFSVLLGV